MAFYPTLKEPEQSVLTTQVFYGYDHNPRARDGAFYHMENMSGRSYPLITTRQGRKDYKKGINNPAGLIAKDQLYWVENNRFFEGGLEVSGLTLDKKSVPKQLVSMGAYIVIWPDKKYFNTQDHTYGSIDNTVTITSGTVKIEPAMQDGTLYDMTKVTSGNAAPPNPQNGTLWIDTSGETHILNRYSEVSGEWTQIPTVYLKISATDIGNGFSAGDGVTLSGFAGGKDHVAEQVKLLNTSTVLHDVGEDYLIIVGMVDQVVSFTAKSVKVQRKCPDMDYICESNNRLWGCRYGLAGGKPVNEIYASKLGDFKNWNTFVGLSTDSYAVSVGTDGVFTGAVNYQGYPMFFKETCIHKVYGTSPASFQMQTSLCRGVEKGSAASLCQVGEVLYYKGRTEVLAYDGSVPQNVGQALGDVRYTDGVGGALGGLYYLSMLGPDGESNLFVYDTEKAMWYRENSERPSVFAQLDDDLYYMTGDAIKTVSGGTETVPWRLDTAVMGYEYPEQKYLSRWLIRAAAEAGQAVHVFFQYDSSGEWEPAGEIVGQGMASSFLVPVIPRRCDHMQLRLKGNGEFKLFSLSRVLEKGGDPIC